MSTREPAKSFTDLIVWQKAHAMVLEVYRLSAGFPEHEKYGLVSQLRRAAVSVAANIAEGFRKLKDGDTVKFMNCAQGSLEECRYYLILSKDLGYGEDGELGSKMEEVSKLLTGYMNAIRKKMRG